MERITRRRGLAITHVVLLVGLGAALSACSAASPNTIAVPYTASDGSSKRIGDVAGGAGSVDLRNFLVVASTKGSTGVVVGAVVNEGTQPVKVLLQVLAPDGQTAVAQTTLTAEPGRLIRLGTDEARLVVGSMPEPAGSVLSLHAQTSAGGVEMSLPVLAPQGQYAAFTAGPASPSPTASTGKAKASSSARAASPTAKATPSPTR